MRNKFEHILLSVLFGIAVLLGLTFWLNIVYGFNLFSAEHWDELARLQVEHIPVNNGFYISIAVAILVLIFGLLFLYISVIVHKHQKKTVKESADFLTTAPILPKQENKEEKEEKIAVEPPRMALNLSQPPKLNLPSNMASVLQQRQEDIKQKQQESPSRYDSLLAQIFQSKGYVIKPNPVISRFTPNLFAIAPNEIVWIGAVDTDTNTLQNAINRLESIFTETLEDIKININAFIIDTKNTQTTSDSIFIFKSVDELKTFVSELPPAWSNDMSDADQDNFDAYSEYIDTIIQYVKNMG